MKRTWKLWALPMLALSLLVLASCEKVLDDATETADSGEDYAQDQTAIAAMVDVAQDVAETQGFMMKNGNSILPENVTIDYKDTVLTDGDGIEIEVDLGAYPGTECNDGWFRYGKLVITSNNKRFSETGASVTLKVPNGLVGLYKGDERYELVFMSTDKIEVTRTAANTFSVNYDFGFTYSDSAMTAPSGQVTGSFNVTQTAGADVPGAANDEFVLTGSSEGANHNGTNYTMTITDGLVRKVDETCSKTFTAGKMEIKNDGSKTALKLEFGDGACDNDVTIVLPGNVKKKYTVK